jgi:hypothetical protein
VRQIDEVVEIESVDAGGFTAVRITFAVLLSVNLRKTTLSTALRGEYLPWRRSAVRAKGAPRHPRLRLSVLPTPGAATSSRTFQQ